MRGGRFALLYIPTGSIVHVEGDSGGTSFMTYGLFCKNPAEDRRFDIDVKTMRKHRTNMAYVVAICEGKLTGMPIRMAAGNVAKVDYCLELVDVEGGYSQQDPDFLYETGKWIEIKDYDCVRDETCSSGIHYFPSSEAAIRYYKRGNTPVYSIYMDADYRYEHMAKFEITCVLLRYTLQPWADEQIKKFTTEHPEVYYYYDSTGAKKLQQSMVTEKEHLDPAIALARALKRLDAEMNRLSDELGKAGKAIQKPVAPDNLVINIGCNIYNGIPASEGDIAEEEDEDDEPP